MRKRWRTFRGESMRNMYPADGATSIKPESPLSSKKKSSASIPIRKRCAIFTKDFPGKEMYIAHMKSKEHFTEVMIAPLVIECTGCPSNKMLLTSWDVHECSGRKEGGLNCNLCSSTGLLRNWHGYCRKRFHQDRLKLMIEKDISVRTCTVCSNMLVLPCWWDLHENTVEYVAKMARKYHERNVLFFK